MNPLGLSNPWANSIEMVALHPVVKLRGINPTELSAPLDDSYLYNWILTTNLDVPYLNNHFSPPNLNKNITK